jgi:spoIIIJ-associated protein
MDVPLDEQGAVAQAFLAGLAREMHLQADITVGRPDADTVEVNLDGSDLGLLIGSKGSTLLALQDLTRTVVQRKTGASNGRLLVDVSGYRHKRKEALERFAQQVAEQVKDAGTRKALEPMNAADRKVVHDAINEIDGVMTTSEGEEPNRRVVIFPAPS